MVLEWPGAINLRWNAIMMKRTAIALTLAGLLTLPAVLPSAAWAAPVRSLQKEQNYDQYISKRQVVDASGKRLK